MKKNYLILLALLVLQGSEQCQAGVRGKLNSSSAENKIQNEKKLAEAAEKLAQAEAEKLAQAEAEKLAQAEAEKLAKEEAEKLVKEEAEKLVKEEAEKQKKLDEERKLRDTLESEFKTLKSENDLKQSELADYKNGKKIPKELIDKISKMNLGAFYGQQIDKAIQKAINATDISSLPSDTYKAALKSLGISDDGSGLKMIGKKIERHQKKLELLKAQTANQDTLSLDAEVEALSNALQEMNDKDFSVAAVRKALMDDSLPGSILRSENVISFLNTNENNNENNNVNPQEKAKTRVQLRYTLEPIRALVENALSDATQRRQAVKDNHDSQQTMEKLLSKLTDLETYLMSKQPIFPTKQSGLRTLRPGLNQKKIPSPKQSGIKILNKVRSDNP